MSQICSICGTKLNCDVEDVAFDLHVLNCISLSTGAPNPANTTPSLTAQEMKSKTESLLNQLASAVEVRLMGKANKSLQEALSKSMFCEMTQKLSVKQLQKIQNTILPQLEALKSMTARREDPSLDTFQNSNIGSPVFVPQRVQNEDDPFYAQENFDTSFTPLPRGLLVVVFQFMGHKKGFFSAAAVNQYWRSAWMADQVWEEMCNQRYGFGSISESWRTTYFLGVCRSLMVSMEGGGSISLPVTIGASVKDMMTCLGIPDGAIGSCFLESEDFSKTHLNHLVEVYDDATECEIRSSWVLKFHVNILFSSPYSVVRVEGVRAPEDLEAWQSSVLSAWRAHSVKAYEKSPEFIRNAAVPP